MKGRGGGAAGLRLRAQYLPYDLYDSPGGGVKLRWNLQRQAVATVAVADVALIPRSDLLWGGQPGPVAAC